jgi:hypothetical protein
MRSIAAINAARRLGDRRRLPLGTTVKVYLRNVVLGFTYTVVSRSQHVSRSYDLSLFPSEDSVLIHGVSDSALDVVSLPRDVVWEDLPSL